MPSTSPLLGDPLPARGRAEGRPSPGLPQGGAEGLGQGARTSRSSPGAPQIRAGGRGVPGQGRIGAPWNQPRSLGLGRPHLHPGTPGSRAGGAHSGPVHGEPTRAARLPRLPPPSGPARLSRAAQVSWCRLLRGLIIDRLDCPRVCQQVAPRAPRRWGPNLGARARARPPRQDPRAAVPGREAELEACGGRGAVWADPGKGSGRYRLYHAVVETEQTGAHSWRHLWGQR